MGVVTKLLVVKLQSKKSECIIYLYYYIIYYLKNSYFIVTIRKKPDTGRKYSFLKSKMAGGNNR